MTRKPHDEVSIDIAAPAERVYDLISDVTRMGEWSPECRKCTWIGSTKKPTVGARFVAFNKGRRGPSWVTPVKVTAAERGREFAFNRSAPMIGSYTWRYVFEPTESGVRVTESYDVERDLPAAMNWLTHKWTGSKDRDDDLHTGMQTTLARVKVAAEAS
jgi:uncharacterized protein YndB with AHSA1/START domain